MDTLSIEELTSALTIVRDSYIADAFDCEMVTHDFSPRFESKMNLMIKRQRKPYYTITNSPMKKITLGFVAALIFSMTIVMSVSALREGFFDMVQQIFEKFSIVSYQSDEISPNIDKPFVEYELTKLPEGYVLTEENIVESMKTKDCEYSNSINSILFNQYSIENADFMINTGGVTLEEIFIDNHTLYYYSNLGIQNVFWDNGEYTFFMSGVIDKETLLDLVNHTKIKE